MEMYRFKYMFKNVVITMDKDYPIREDFVVSFAMVWDPAHRTMPVVRVVLHLEKDLVVLLYQYKDTAKVKFDIYEMMYDGDDNKIDTKMWLQHSWSIVPVRDITHYLHAQDIETIQYSDPMAQPQAMQLYLYDKDWFNIFSKQMSINIEDCAKPSILQYLFEERGVPAKTWVATPPEDSSVNDETVLEMGTLVNNVDELNTRYGIYTANALIFYDFERLYCINRLEPNVIIKSATEFDNVTFTLINSADPESKVIGGTTDYERKKHFINLNGAPEIRDIKDDVYSSEFSTLESIDAIGEVNKFTVKDNITRLNYIYKHNPLTQQYQVNEKLLTDQFVSFILSYCPISFFKMYKTYTFVVGSQYTNLDIENHRYRLLYLEFGITKEGSEYESSTQVILYRVRE